MFRVQSKCMKTRHCWVRSGSECCNDCFCINLQKIKFAVNQSVRLSSRYFESNPLIRCVALFMVICGGHSLPAFQ